jgi:hypothetical protein
MALRIRKFKLFSHNWSGELILFALPLFLILVNSNWIFTPVKALPFTPFQDTWFYTGNFFHFFDYATSGYTTQHYFIERLPWNLPGYYLYHLSSPLIGNYLLHLFFYYMAIFSLYIILRELISKRSALIASLAMGTYPWFMRAVGWDYVDGAGIAYFLMALALLVLSVKKRQWSVYVLLSGAATACLIFTNPFWVAFLPGMLIVFLIANHLYRKRNLLVSALLFGAGGIITTGLFGAFYYSVTGRFIFFKNSLALMQTMGNSKDLSSYLLIYYRGMDPHWLLLPGLLVIASCAFFVFQQGKHDRHTYLMKIALIIQFFFSCTWLVYWHFNSLPYLLIFLYSSYLIPSAFLVFGALIDNSLELLTNQQFLVVILACVLIFVAPLVLSTVMFAMTIVQGKFILIAIVSLLFIIALLIHRRFSVILACISVALIGFFGGADTNVFVKDRWKGKDSFLAIVETVKLIDTMYPTDYRNLVLMYDSYNFDIPGMAIGGIYQDVWSDKILFQEKSPINWITIEPGSGRDILLISENEDTYTELEKSFAYKSKNIQFHLNKAVPVRVGNTSFFLTFFRLDILPETLSLEYDKAFEFDYPIKSSNLHFPETSPNGKTFEWSGAETDTKIYVRLPESEKDLSLHICAFVIQDEILKDLRLFVNDIPIPIEIDSTENCPVMIYGTIPSDAVDENPSETEFMFRTAYTISPAEAGTNQWDPRKVGVALDWIEIER